MSNVTTGTCAQCKQTAVEIIRERVSRRIVDRRFPSGPVVEIRRQLTSLFLHVACRDAFIEKVRALEPMKAIDLA